MSAAICQNRTIGLRYLPFKKAIEVWLDYIFAMCTVSQL